MGDKANAVRKNVELWSKNKAKTEKFDKALR